MSLSNLGKWVESPAHDAYGKLVGWYDGYYVIQLFNAKGHAHNASRTRKREKVHWIDEKFADENYSDEDLWNITELQFKAYQIEEPVIGKPVKSNNLFNIDDL